MTRFTRIPKVERHLEEYELRDANVRKMGIQSYAAYLCTNQWRSIRKQVLDRDDNKCVRCGGTAYQVHHASYSLKYLRGKSLTKLHAVCGTCHKNAEFRNGRKTTIQEATDYLFAHKIREFINRPYVNERTAGKRDIVFNPPNERIEMR